MRVKRIQTRGDVSVYPKLANWIRFKKINEKEYIVYDLMQNEEFVLDEYLVWFAKKLDGSVNPHTIDGSLTESDVDDIIFELKERNIIRKGRLLNKSLVQILVTLWQPKFNDIHRIIAFLLNGLLMISVLPLSVISVHTFITDFNDLDFEYIFIGLFAGTVAGVVVHEFGHAIACLGYGGRVFEVGVGLQYLIPCAYVLINDKNIKNRLRRVQVSAAGIEMNIVLADICMLIAVKTQITSGLLVGMIIQNIFLAIINLTFVNGFDGMTIMSELLGADNFVVKAKKVLKNKSKKKELIKSGVSGKATITACYLIRGVQIALPLILIVDVLGVILCVL